LSKFTKPHNAIALARIETHYFLNKGFISENQILRNMVPIQNIPAVLIHGRYDMVCPLDNATELHKYWPTSDLQIVRESGHSASEPGTIDALVRATQSMAKRLNDAS
jgi:proline iminopeptidase